MHFSHGSIVSRVLVSSAGSHIPQRFFSWLTILVNARWHTAHSPFFLIHDAMFSVFLCLFCGCPLIYFL